MTLSSKPSLQNIQAIAAAVQVVRQLYGAGKAREALVVADNVLGNGQGAQAMHAELFNLAGACALQLRNLSRAERLFREAMRCNPSYAEAPGNLGVVLVQAGKPAEAELAFARAVVLRPDNLNALNNRILLLLQLGRYAEAEAACQQFLTRSPAHPEVYNSLGLALSGQGRGDEAEAAFRQALALRPVFPEAHNNLGNMLRDRHADAEAEAAYRAAIGQSPHYADALSNLGNLFRVQRRHDEAEVQYRAVIALNPAHAGAWNNLGSLLAQVGQEAEAEAAFRHVLTLESEQASAWNNLGRLLHKQDRIPEAIDAYARVVALQPQDGRALSHLIMLRRQIADWQGLDHAEATLLQSLDDRIEPFELLAIPAVTPAQLREAGRRYAEAGAGSQLQMPPLVQRRPQPKARLRIGYLSADFHAHATVYLLAGVLEHHDAAHVELILYSYGPASSSGERQRLLERADAFHDLRELSDEAAARRIADDHIDILVDLKGYTVGQRPGITALRPAPLIVNWLGYPGSLGHPRMADYLIGDPVVSPPEHAAHFSEALALLPHCYQPNDNRRPLEPAPSRADAGLPATGLVFCSFNQTYKLRPETFAWWCRLLAAVPSSVLWLWQPKHETGVANLRRAAAGHGIAPERLVFAPSLPQAGHLARLQLADLALDSFPVCSHTTASDALWAGVPLVTRRGETFVSRVAASLLTAAGLADLVTASDEACFELALALATDPARLAAVRERLRGNRLTCPLFDTAGYTRDLEALYQRIWAEACNSVYPRG